MALAELVSDEKYTQELQAKHEKEEKEYMQAHPVPIQDQTIQTPEQLSEYEAQQYEAKRKEKEKVQAQKDKSAQMHKVWDNFCRSLNKEDFEKATDLQQELKDEGYPDQGDLKLVVYTNELYQKGFQFADVAKYDYSVENFNKLDASENNLNVNIENPNLLTDFISTAHEVAKNLKEKYGDGWNLPEVESDG